ncbi:hypothetical protein WA026_004537 [Henosepilachna vigintioctopunctata]|uniref:Uncharacterized protein n=1 Tax=Henosepilachna vigintioctopunctata TaxID=420089 RepID=A0AAW1VAJ9_9CUCU
MTHIIRVFVLIFSACYIHGKKIKVDCPSYCECDVFAHLNRATCVNRTIVEIQLDLPPFTQILDLSHNQISQIDENAFQYTNLLKLKFLNISFNKLGQISIFAFDGLNELVALDLSYNAIKYIVPNWFNSMKHLENLYLRGNNLGDMINIQKYAFNSNSLKLLDLSKSFIYNLAPNIFKLPNLEYLDLSENQLLSLSPKVITHLKNLKQLKITNNTFACNKVSHALKRFIIQRKINFEDPCLEKTPIKFEKLEMETTTLRGNFWNIEDNQNEIILVNNSIEKIPNYPLKEKNNSLICISEFPYIIIIIAVLIYGLLIGFICGSGVKSCKIKHRIKRYRAKNLVKLKHMKILDEETLHLSSDIDPVGQSTPILIRGLKLTDFY